MFGLYLSIVVLYVVLSKVYVGDHLGYHPFLQNMLGIMAVLAWFSYVSSTKKHKIVKYAMLDIIPYDQDKKLIQDHILRTFMVFISIAIYTTICVLPSFIIKRNMVLLTENNHTYIFPKILLLSMRQIVGIHIIIIILTLIVGYGILLLPKLLSEKIENQPKKEHIYIYWYYFILHKFNSQPFLHYLLLPMFIVSSACVIFFPFATRGHSTISLENLFELDSFSFLVTILGVWLTILIVIINDIMSDYFRLHKCYEEYTTYKILNNFHSSGNFKYAIIGFGNLSKILNGLLIPQLYSAANIEKRKLYKNFDVIIDKAYNLRLVYRGIIVIEKDKSLFEEIRTSETNGFTFGFFNGLECIDVSYNESKSSDKIAILGINGKGENLSILRDIDFEKIEIIINTSSDLDMGLKLKKIIETSPSELHRPVLISTVEDSTSYSFLEGVSKSPIFPLHTGRIEGAAIGNRLFMFYNMSLKEKYDTKKNILVGSGKSMYYTIDTFRRTLKLFETEQKTREIVEEVFHVFTSDPNILKECTSGKHDTLKWNIVFSDGHIYNIKLFSAEPTRFSGVLKFWKTLEKDKAFDTIFVVSTPLQYDTLRISEHLKQLISLHLDTQIYLLISSGHESKDEINEIIRTIPTFNKPNKGFPHDRTDLIIAKNSIIGSQIISMAGFNVALPVNKKRSDDDLNSEIVLCCNDSPYSYINSLLSISKFKSAFKGKPPSIIPSFYYSYSYPLVSYKDDYKNTFVFRADAYLITDVQYESNHSINSYYINCSNRNRTQINAVLEKRISLKKVHCKSCGRFNERCPITSDYELKNKVDPRADKLELDDSTRLDALATIKIWAEKEDVPGALALSIADFLMIGDTVQANINTGDSIFNVVYEYCNLCNLDNNTIARLYTTINQVDEPLKDEVKKLFDYRNIKAIKIKPANDAGHWNDYSFRLNDYLNELCKNKKNKYSYDLIPDKDKNVILIIRNDIPMINSDARNFINESL